MTNRKHKCVMIIVDGLGDRPVPRLGGKTPLEAAATPNLDLLAGAGCYGQVDPIAPGVTPNTHSGAGILPGLPPIQAGQLRRGPVEAAGAGRVLRAGEVALRVNFASIEAAGEGFIVTDRRAGRIEEGTAELGAAIAGLDLGDGVFAEFHSTDQHRGVLVLSGDQLDAAVSDTDPGDEAIPAPLLHCEALRPGARRTADKVNSFVETAHRLLRKHPVNLARAAMGKPLANGVLTRGAGAWVAAENVLRQMGLDAALISGCNTVRGLGRMFGFEIVEDARFTATVDTDLEAKFQAALAALQSNDLAYVHVKAPDICAHDRQPEAKRDFLQRLDGAVAALIGRDIVIALSADHTTDSNRGMHTADPVPTLLFYPRCEPGICGIKFGELACRNGTMERQTSGEFLQRVLSAVMGRNHNPESQPQSA